MGTIGTQTSAKEVPEGSVKYKMNSKLSYDMYRSFRKPENCPWIWMT